MDTLGSRLRSERKKIGLSQTAFAELAGLRKQSQVHYETGKRYPDGNYLSAIAKHGVDVLYVLTGRRETGNANFAPKKAPTIRELRRKYRPVAPRVPCRRPTWRDVSRIPRATFLPDPWRAD